MIFLAFWVGGQVATVLMLWAEWYGDREFPASVRALSPLQVALAVFLCVGFWPGFAVLVALKRRQVHDENEADQELADELARRFPETHGGGHVGELPLDLPENVPPLLCKWPCGYYAGPTVLCPWCARFGFRGGYAVLTEPEQHEEGPPVNPAVVRAGADQRDE
jgi:hypothetical protein